MTTLPKIYLKSHRDQRVEGGHLWAFSNEIERIDGKLEPGGLCDLYSHRQKFLARGFHNPHSLIAFRALTVEEEYISVVFFEKRVQSALKLRERLYPNETAYRLIFGESDLMPGLVVDRYNKTLVLQSYCLGMDLLTPQIAEALRKTLSPSCIIKKNDSSLRALEGLKEETGILEGKEDFPLEITQKAGGRKLKFQVDPLGGQKTGFFFDQRENRAQILKYSEGKRVLDCYSYSGAFGLYAAAGGAADVICVDSSEPACELTRANFALNGLEGRVLKADVEKALAGFLKEKSKFDIIVLDPPALAKTKKNFYGALRKYLAINEAAVKLLSPGGILISCSCSHHLERGDFTRILGEAAKGAGRLLRIIEMRGAAGDHPIHPAMPETEYLKCAIAQVE